MLCSIVKKSKSILIEANVHYFYQFII